MSYQLHCSLALLASWVLHVSMAEENKDRRSFHFFHHKCFLQQLLSYTTIVYIKKQLYFGGLVRTHFIDSNKGVQRRLSLCNSASLSPVCGSASRPISSSLLPILERLYGDGAFRFRFRTAASKTRQVSGPARVRAAQNERPSLASASMRTEFFQHLGPFRSASRLQG